jgi:hypothetical protein
VTAARVVVRTLGVSVAVGVVLVAVTAGDELEAVSTAAGWSGAFVV